jgi:hypothetical protein
MVFCQKCGSSDVVVYFTLPSSKVQWIAGYPRLNNHNTSDEVVGAFCNKCKIRVVVGEAPPKPPPPPQPDPATPAKMEQD